MLVHSSFILISPILLVSVDRFVKMTIGKYRFLLWKSLRNDMLSPLLNEVFKPNPTSVEREREMSNQIVSADGYVTF